MTFKYSFSVLAGSLFANLFSASIILSNPTPPVSTAVLVIDSLIVLNSLSNVYFSSLHSSESRLSDIDSFARCDSIYFNMDSNSKLVGLSTKIQQHLSSALQNMPVLSRPSNFFDSLQSKPDMISRRVKSGRNPSTGLIHKVQSASPLRPSTATTGGVNMMKINSLKGIDTNKLNTRVIEG